MQPATAFTTHILLCMEKADFAIPLFALHGVAFFLFFFFFFLSRHDG